MKFFLVSNNYQNNKQKERIIDREEFKKPNKICSRNNIIDTSLSSLPFTNRTRSALYRGGVRNIYDLIDYFSLKKLLTLSGIGKKAFNEIKGYIELVQSSIFFAGITNDELHRQLYKQEYEKYNNLCNKVNKEINQGKLNKFAKYKDVPLFELISMKDKSVSIDELRLSRICIENY